ncbi:hypothetical protein MT390_09125 [Vibrio sp. 2-Bac 85]
MHNENNPKNQKNKVKRSRLKPAPLKDVSHTTISLDERSERIAMKYHTKRKGQKKQAEACAPKSKYVSKQGKGCGWKFKG